MKKTQVLIWGAGGHALVVADILQFNEKYAVAGFLDDIHTNSPSSTFLGVPLWSGREPLDVLRAQGIVHLIVAVGDCRARLELSEFALAKGFQLVTAIHPNSVIARDVSIGEGSVIAPGVVINPKVHIGKNVIINNCVSVGHECRIEDGVHISPGANLGGAVKVGEGSWIGIGSVVKDNVKIGSNVTVGAGSVVLRDLPDNVVAYGVPAQIRSTNDQQK